MFTLPSAVRGIPGVLRFNHCAVEGAAHHSSTPSAAAIGIGFRIAVSGIIHHGPFLTDRSKAIDEWLKVLTMMLCEGRQHLSIVALLQVQLASFQNRGSHGRDSPGVLQLPKYLSISARARDRHSETPAQKMRILECR